MALQADVVEAGAALHDDAGFDVGKARSQADMVFDHHGARSLVHMDQIARGAAQVFLGGHEQQLDGLLDGDPGGQVQIGAVGPERAVVRLQPALQGHGLFAELGLDALGLVGERHGQAAEAGMLAHCGAMREVGRVAAVDEHQQVRARHGPVRHFGGAHRGGAVGEHVVAGAGQHRRRLLFDQQSERPSARAPLRRQFGAGQLGFDLRELLPVVLA